MSSINPTSQTSKPEKEAQDFKEMQTMCDSVEESKSSNVILPEPIPHHPRRQTRAKSIQKVKEATTAASISVKHDEPGHTIVGGEPIGSETESNKIFSTANKHLFQLSHSPNLERCSDKAKTNFRHSLPIEIPLFAEEINILNDTIQIKSKKIQN